jgi:hypothetical protein
MSIFPTFDKLKTINESSARASQKGKATAVTPVPEGMLSMTPTIVRIDKRKLDFDDPSVQHARRRLFPHD